MRKGGAGGIVIGGILLFAAGLLLATGCSAHRGKAPESHRTAGVPSGIPTPRTAWERVLTQIQSSGRVSAGTALQAFVLAIGPLPGVKEPEGPQGPIPSGTVAVRWVFAHWKELNAAQRVAIKRYLTPRRRRPTRVAFASIPLERDVQLGISEPSYGPYQAMANAARDQIASHIGTGLRLGLYVELNPSEVVFFGKKNRVEHALAYAVAADPTGGATGSAATCTIFLNPSLYQHSTSQVVAETFPHEVYHCFEAQDYNSVAAFNSAPSWLIEGQAEWVGDTLAGSGEAAVGFWSQYFVEPRKPLFQRSYDALGFYSELSYVGIDTWTRLELMLRASSNDEAYLEAIAPNPNAFESRWASSYGRSHYRDPSLDPAEWDSDGPGISAAMFVPNISQVPNRTVIGPFAIGSYTNRFIISNLKADVISFQTTSSLGRVNLPDNQEVSGATLENLYLCTRPDGCAPPENCVGAHVTPMTKTIPGLAYIALTGAHTGSKYTIRGLSIADFYANACAPANTTAQQGSNAQGTRAQTACQLVTAAAVSAVVRERVTTISTYRSPESLCAFASFPQDMHVTTKEWMPHSREVEVALFTPRTMREPGVGSVIASVGCRDILPQCERALADDSPSELYEAQRNGAYPCRGGFTSCIIRDNVTWARRGNEVVAINVLTGSEGEGSVGPSSTMELGILNNVWLNL